MRIDNRVRSAWLRVGKQVPSQSESCEMRSEQEGWFAAGYRVSRAVARRGISVVEGFFLGAYPARLGRYS